MHVWICDGCHAEIAEKVKPDICPLCGSAKGFSEGEREEQPKEDKKYSEIYEHVVEDLKKYDEGTEPEKLKYCFDE